MPIIKDTAPVSYPNTDYRIVKYLDLTKFISLLQRKSLFFCRLDKLEDQFEGITAKPNYQYRFDSLKYLKANGDLEISSEKEITDLVEKKYKYEKTLKSIYCVNCWNKKEEESAALWKIYSDFSKGIMIKSSILQLENSLCNVESEIRLSEIKYIDYNNDIMPDGNSMFPLIHKHIAYSFEDEVRLIHEVINEGWVHDWSKEEVEEGVYIKVDLDILIDEIIIGPYAPKWFFELVRDISQRYGLTKAISKSKLSVT